MIKTILLNLLCLFIISCASTQVSTSPPNFKKPSDKASVYYPKNNWTIRDQSDLAPLLDKLKGSKLYTQDGVSIVDLNGGVIDGNKQSGSGGQDENQEPLFRAEMSLALKNGFVRNNKNAATFNAPYSGVKNITFTNIGEDAVATSKKATNFLVDNCEFINKKGGDKSIQLNQAKGAQITDNLIYGGITGVRVHESSWTSSKDEAYCGGNLFVGVDTAWNVSKGKLIVTKKNSYNYVRLPFKVSNRGQIVDPDGSVKKD